MKGCARGITLIEMLVAVIIIAIVILIGAPTLRELTLNNRQVTAINDLMTSLNLARAEAVKRGVRTAVCRGSAAPGCENTPAGCCDKTAITTTNGWEQGWFGFVDTNQDSNLNNDPGDALIQRHEGLPEGTTLRGNNNVEDRVMFNYRGASGSPGTLRLCDSRGNAEARGIVILGTGRLRLAIDTDSTPDGIVNEGNNNNVSCP
jgi:type IV fimbrial biogenesis protein FimT